MPPIIQTADMAGGIDKPRRARYRLNPKKHEVNNNKKAQPRYPVRSIRVNQRVLISSAGMNP
jgi:hypothetical protein